MTATKRLCELLDERGILYDTAYDVTMWTGSDGHGCTASEIFSRQNGKPTMKHLMIRRVMTPEQAIAATLGAGTCRRIRGHRSYRTQGGYRIECSECGYGLADRRYRYCPNCGRQVVE